MLKRAWLRWNVKWNYEIVALTISTILMGCVTMTGAEPCISPWIDVNAYDGREEQEKKCEYSMHIISTWHSIFILQQRNRNGNFRLHFTRYLLLSWMKLILQHFYSSLYDLVGVHLMSFSRYLIKISHSLDTSFTELCKDFLLCWSRRKFKWARISRKETK